MSNVDITGRILPGNEWRFFQLLIKHWMASAWLEHFQSLEIRSVLDLGMGDPITPIMMAAEYGATSVEGYDGCSEAVGLNAALTVNGDLKCGSLREVIDSFCPKVAEQERDRIFRALELHWDHHLGLSGPFPKQEKYDLVILSNVMHYWVPKQVEFIMRKLRPVLAKSRYIYIHTMDVSWAEKLGVSLDVVKDAAQKVAEGRDFYVSGPFIPEVALQNPEKQDQGFHYTWTNLWPPPPAH